MTGERRGGDRPLRAWPVVSGVNALLVRSPVNLDPIGPIHAPLVAAGGTEGKRTGQLDPTSLFPGNNPDLPGDLREVLVLTEEEANVVPLPMRHSADVQCDPDINAFLLTGPDCPHAAVWKGDHAVPVSERSRVNHNAPAPHHSPLGGPEVMPERVIGGGGHTSVEPDPYQVPRAGAAHRGGKGRDIVVGDPVAKGVPRAVEEILPIHESDGTLSRPFSCQREERNNPARGLAPCRAGSK